MLSNQHDRGRQDPLDISPLARTKRRRQFWERAFREERACRDLDPLLMEDLHPLRVRVAFRVVREIAKIKQICYDNEPLASLLEIPGFDGWIEAVDPPEDFTGMDKAQRWIAQAKIPLLPPIDEDGYRDMTPCYFKAFNLIYRRLGIYQMEDLRKGYMGLTDASHYRRLWPTLEDILGYENAFLHELLSLISHYGSLRARDEARVLHGLRRWEEDSFFSIATSGAVELMSGTAEEGRAVMLMRLEDFINRCRAEGDLRAELACFKLIGDLQNLRKAPTHDLGSQLVDVVRERSLELEEKQKNEFKQMEDDSDSAGKQSG